MKSRSRSTSNGMDKVPNTNALKAPKMRPIARKRRNYVYLLLAVLFAITTVAIFLNRPPSYNFEVMNFSVPILPIFIVSIGAFLFTLLTFIFNNKLYGAITTVILISILILRLVYIYF